MIFSCEGFILLLRILLPINTDSPAHSFRARRALCRVAWQRSSVILRMQAPFRAPPKTIVPIVYLPFGGIAPSSLRLFFYRRRATEEAASKRWAYCLASTLFCHALLPQGICFSGAGQWAAPLCAKIATRTQDARVNTERSRLCRQRPCFLPCVPLESASFLPPSAPPLLPVVFCFFVVGAVFFLFFY